MVLSYDEKSDENCMKIMSAEIFGHHSRVRQKKRRGDMIQQDQKFIRL